ncbi:mitotic checkpoint protein BUB3 [Trichonephila clavipes]|nr:mitotic checkpoint protein BUB3 [Trichonephila clavipes]
MDHIVNEAEEIYQRLIRKKSVLGVMVFNENGIRTSMDNVTTTEMVNALVPLNDLARKTVKDLDPCNELLFFRVRTNKNEIMIGVVNGDRYRAMITNFFIPELNNHDVQELWFQQDSATCPTARAAIDLLKDTFGDRLISRFGPVNWPPRSCDLTPLDYFLWGYVKSLDYADKPQTLDHLEDNIRCVIADIRPQMLEKVIENWTPRLDYIRASRGSHMPEIIFKIINHYSSIFTAETLAICQALDDLVEFNKKTYGICKLLSMMTLSDATNEFELDDVPSDLISSVNFGPSSSQFLLSSSWDHTVRLFDVTNNTSRMKYEHDAPVLDCCFQDQLHCWSGDLLGHLKTMDINSNEHKIVGVHGGAIRCVEYCPDIHAIITGSWDQTVKLWDVRAFEAPSTYRVPDKVYTMAVCGDRLIIGTAGRRIVIYDLRAMSYAQQVRESSLKYQTRCIRSFPNKQGYVVSSIEGRIAVEYMDTSAEAQKKKYAFKCHRIKEDNGVELIYPINCIAFHSGYNTFATGGSDGYVNIWDGFNKTRLCRFHRYPTHISALAFSPDGSLIAVASSFIYDAEQKYIPPDSISIRTVTDQETKPK